MGQNVVKEESCLEPITDTASEERKTGGRDRDPGVWTMAPRREGESVRWQKLDGRWIVLSPGHGVSADRVLVMDSVGRFEVTDSFERAFELARHWRAH